MSLNHLTQNGETTDVNCDNKGTIKHILKMNYYNDSKRNK